MQGTGFNGNKAGWRFYKTESQTKSLIGLLLTPAYPAIALLVAGCIERIVNGASTVSLFWRKAAAASFVVVGLVYIPLVLTIGARILGRTESLALIGLIPILHGGIAWFASTAKTQSRFVEFEASKVGGKVDYSASSHYLVDQFQ